MSFIPTGFTENKRGMLASVENSVTNSDITFVYLHGWLDNAATHYPLMRELSEKYPTYQHIAIDLPGHGKSDHLSEQSYYSFHDYICILYRWLTECLLDEHSKIVLIGHSLGGLISGPLASMLGNKVIGLVQIEALYPLWEEGSVTERLLRSVQAQQRARRRKIKGQKSQKKLLQLRAHTNQLPEELLTAIIDRGTVQKDKQWFWGYDPKVKLQSPIRMSESQSRQVIEELSVPHLVVAGQTGFDDVRQQMKELKAINTKLDCHIIEYTGHHCQLEKPIDVAFVIGDFFSRYRIFTTAVEYEKENK